MLSPVSSAASTARGILSPIGSSLESNLSTTLPARSTRNLLKFHLIFPANFGFVSFPVRNAYNGCMLFPFTEIFANSGKVTP